MEDGTWFAKICLFKTSQDIYWHAKLQDMDGIFGWNYSLSMEKERSQK